EFNELVDSGQVKEVVLVGTDRATGKVRDPNSDQAKNLRLNGGKFSVLLPLVDDQTKLIREWEAKDQQYREELKKQNQSEPEKLSVSKRDEPTWLGPFLLNMLLLGFVIAVIVFFFLPRIRDPMGGGFLNSYIRSPAKRYEKGKGRVTFEDVAGMESAKRELQEVVDYLKDPAKFT